MAITFVGANSAASTSVSIPAHQTGDLLIILATRQSSSPPSLPAGWTQIAAPQTSSFFSMLIGYRVATSNSETSGTWSNAGTTSVSVYRGVDSADPIGASATSGNVNNTFSYPGLTLQVNSGSSWVYRGLGYYNSGTRNALSGFTQRSDQTGGTNRGVVYDTNAGVSSLSSATQPNSAFTWWVTASIEILAGAEEPSGTDYEETVTALAADVSLTASGTKGFSATTSLTAGTSITASGVVDASSTSSLDTEASVSAAGSVAASATSGLPAAASLTAIGSAAATTDAATLATEASFSSTGTKGTNTSADDLVAQVDFTASGTAAARATTDLDVVTDLEASGTAGVAASTSLDTTTTVTATGSVAASAAASLETLLSPDASGSAAASATTSLDTDVSVASEGTTGASSTASLAAETTTSAAGSAAASSDADPLAASAGSEPTNVADLLVASDLLEATLLFVDAESELSSELSASFTLTVDFESPTASSAVSDSALFPVTLEFGFADLDGTNSTSAELSVQLAFSNVDSLVSAAGTASLDSLVILEDTSSSRGYTSEASLAVDVGYGSVTVRRSLDWSIYIAVSEIVTDLPNDLLVTAIPDLSDCACIPTLEISTVIPEDGVQTVIDGVEIQTVIGNAGIQTSLPFDELVTSIPDATVDTLLEEE